MLPCARISRRATYLAAVDKAKEYIAAGDIFQVVLAQRFEVDLPTAPFEVYRALRIVNPSPYMYFLKMPERRIVGSSPEMLVRVREQRDRIPSDCRDAAARRQ